MRYELDNNGWVCKVFFGCASGNCTKYTGTVPEGYATLEEWADNANIRAYKIANRNLVYDSNRSAELQLLWDLQNKHILWQGSKLMSGSDTVELIEKVSAQLNGIILVWSGHTNGVGENWNWTYCFVPKQHIQYANGAGVDMLMCGTSFNIMACKYVYVADNILTGHPNNILSGQSTSSNIAYNNNEFVLRYVLGV